MDMHPILELLLPELILAVGASLILLFGLSRVTSQGSTAVALLSIAGALFAAARLVESSLGEFEVAALNNGPLVWYVRLVTLCVGVLILLVNRHVPEDRERGEFTALILFSLCGVSLVAVANNLVLLFLALELVSVPTYILIGLSRRDIQAQEATGKYFFLGAFAAAITLYGFSFLYGAAGTLTLFVADPARGPSIMGALATPEAMGDPLVLVGLFFSMGGLAFKIAAVPFHFYVADVYQGAASPITGMLGFVPKLAGFVALIQILTLTGWQHSDAIFWPLWALAAATMTVGNTLALMQHNIKRMLAYSSIAHSGYMLMALVAGPGLGGAAESSPMRNGLTALLFYMAVYGVMNLGAFAAISFFRMAGPDDPEDSIEQLDDLAGAARRHPWACLALAICVLGLMGFPLTGGFLGKLALFSAVLSAADPASALVEVSSMRSTGLIVLVVIGALNAAVAAAYYLRILATCYLRKPAVGIAANRCHALKISLGFCALLVLTAFVMPGGLIRASRKAVQQVSRTTHRFSGVALPNQRAAVSVHRLAGFTPETSGHPSATP
ncbi:MAG: NADH-quinone oxidoreductase subunit N [Phycisphaerae bacterium]